MGASAPSASIPWLALGPKHHAIHESMKLVNLDDLISETKVTCGLAEVIIQARYTILLLPRVLPIPWQFHPKALMAPVAP
jgi:hypothetical protein